VNISISNIAWDVAEDQAMAELFKRFGIGAIDIAPGKYFPDPVDARDSDILRIRNAWGDRGIQIIGMQALLFGTSGLNVFGTPKSRESMLEHLKGVCSIGAGLGATRLVFGSPKNRDRSGLDDQQALDLSVSFFQELGAIAKHAGVEINLEPNPAHYGANFMTTSEETARIVREVSHPAVKMQFDTGSLAINGEDPEHVLREHGAIIGHVHISEPDLLPLGDGTTSHQAMSAAIRKHLALDWVTIETLATAVEPHIVSVERSLKVAIEHYRGSTTGERE